MCYDVNINTGEFTYLLGRRIDNPDDLNNITSDMVRINISGLYAVFSTQPTEQEEQYIQTPVSATRYLWMGWVPDTPKCILLFVGAYGMSLGMYFSTRRNYRHREEHGCSTEIKTVRLKQGEFEKNK